MKALTQEEEKAALISLCRIEIKRWKVAAEGVPEKGYMVKLMEAALAALTSEPVAVPEGWKLVPVELTEEMWVAWQRMRNVYVDDKYRAMLAAAPEFK